MRRTDDAFKQEVLRRYGVQAKNRRNLRILALSPLIFCVFIAAVLWLPSAFDSAPPPSESQPTETTVADTKEVLPEEHPLTKYLGAPIEELRCFGGEYYTLRPCTKEETSEVLAKISKLSVSKPSHYNLDPTGPIPYLYFKFTDSSTTVLRFCENGIIELNHTPTDKLAPSVLEYYRIPENEMVEFRSYLRMLGSPSSDPTLNFDECLQNPAQSITAHDIYLKKGTERLQKALQELHYTETGAFYLPASTAMTIRITCADAKQLRLLFFPDGKVYARHTPPDKEWYFEISQEELSALHTLVDEIIEENTTNLASLIISSGTISTLRLQNTRTQQTAVTTTDPAHFSSVVAMLNQVTVTPSPYLELDIMGYQLTFSDRSGETTQLIFDPSSAVVCLVHTGFGGMKDISWYSIAQADAQSVIAFATQLERTLFAQTTPPDPEVYLPNSLTQVKIHAGQTTHIYASDDIAPLLDFMREKLDSATLLYSPYEYNPLYELQIDENGLRTNLCLDSQTNTITVTIDAPEELSNVYYFSLSKEDMKAICVWVSSLVGGENPPETVAPIYPTLGNLCTEVYPTADHMRLYTEYLSSYDSVFDSATINEVMQMLHGLKLTEQSAVPEYVFNQPIVNLWFTGYDYYVMLDDQGGWVRTFLYANDEVTLLESKLYQGTPSEIAVITDYLKNLNRNSWADSLQLASLDTFRSFMKQSAASVELAPYSHFSLPFQSTDTKVIAMVINEILSMNLIDQKEGFSADYYNDSPYVNIQFANGSWAILSYNTTGYVEYRLHDEKAGIDYIGRYHLPAAEVKAFAEFIDPYLNAEPADDAPRIEDLTDNATLQSFLASVGVTVKGAPVDAPLEIQRILNNYDNTAHFFACELSYTSPDGVNLDYMLYDYYGSDRSPLSDAERLALVKAGVHPEVIGHVEFSRYTLEEIRSILEDNLAYMPAFADNLHEELLKYTVYVPETDCYYQFHSDSLGYIVGVNARMYHTDRADTVIVLFRDYFYGGLQVAAFRIVDGVYKLYGYTALPNA